MIAAESALDIQQHIDIKAPIDKVYEGMLQEFSALMRYPDGRSMNMILERKPGGRWYRDLGDNAGHLWGHVQSIKPPHLLELVGPLFMSYPAVNHVECRLSETDGMTRVTLRHRAIGPVEDQHSQGVSQGWQGMLDEIKKNAEQ
ncbi:MAG TPA: SRPBCC domain-containing protein [Candidatus Hydrogenedentes bacterium]|nr:SRPBCC domain-containing protein [Candidatus Hydrogenedentota bacterium]